MQKLIKPLALAFLMLIAASLAFVAVLAFVPKDQSKRKTIYIDLPKRETTAAYSNEEVICLTRMIYGESRNQPFEGQVAVGAVAVNRGLHANWKFNLCEVVREPNQFHGYWAAHNPKNLEAWNVAKRAALISLSIPEEYEGMYFFDTGRGSFHKGLQQLAVIEDHKFYGQRRNF